MKSIKVTDPAILAQLNGGTKKVTDPGLLAQLNGEDDEEIPYTPPPEKTGFSGILDDVEKLPGKALDYTLNLPHQAFESGKQIYNQPGRALKNLLAGVGEAGIGALNIPHEGLKYLGKKHVIPNWLKKYNELPFTHIPNLGIEEAIGLGKNEPGDEFLRQLPALIAGVKALKSVPGVSNATERIKALRQHGTLKQKVSELANQHEVATAEHAKAESEHNSLKDYLESLPGFESSKPSVLNRKAAETQESILNLRKKSQETPENFRTKTEVTEEPIKQAESLLKTHEQKSAELEKQQSENLGKGYSHDVPIAEGVVSHIKNVKKDIGKIYDKAEQSLKDENIVLPREESLKKIEQEARKSLEDSKPFFKNDSEYEKTVSKIVAQMKPNTGNDIIPASNVLSNYRSLRHLSQKLRKKAYSSDVASNKDLQKDILAQAEEMEVNANNLENLLESHDLGSSLETLKEANKRWREEVVPVNKNSVYNQFLNKGYGNDNIIKSLRGNGSGQQIIRDIIKNDPKLLKHALGQRYAENPTKLHEFDELANEYIENSPETQEFKKQHLESKNNEVQAKSHLENVKSTNAAKSEHFKIQEEIKNLEKKHATLTNDSSKLQEKLNRKNITLKEKINLEKKLSETKKQLSKIQKDRNLLRKALKTGAYGLGTLIIGGSLLQKGKSALGIGE